MRMKRCVLLLLCFSALVLSPVYCSDKGDVAIIYPGAEERDMFIPVGVSVGYVFTPTLPVTQTEEGKLPNTQGGINLSLQGRLILTPYQLRKLGADFAISMVSFPWGDDGDGFEFYAPGDEIGAHLGMMIGYSFLMKPGLDIFVDAGIGYSLLVQTHRFLDGSFNLGFSMGGYVEGRMNFMMNRFGITIGAGLDVFFWGTPSYKGNHEFDDEFAFAGLYAYLGAMYYI